MAAISVKVNGREISKEISDNTLLSDFLRDDLALTGTHVGCDTSQCGACVVHLNGNSVKSCTTLVADCAGSEITTIEGLASNEKMHPIQDAFKKNHGLQCGFCTPGMVMSAVDLLKKNKNPSEQEIRNWLEGNFCRCTGYQGIVAASKEVGKSIPSLAVLAESIGDPQVRNRGTIGGSIANNDPAADYPSACLALNATIHTSKRKIPADKFFKEMFETDLKKGELIEAVEFEIPEKSAYAKFPNPASRYAIVGVYVAKLKKETRVAVIGVQSCVFRCKKLEDALSGNFSPSVIDSVNISSKGFNADIHASAEYRAHIIKVMTKKAVSSC